MHAVSGKKRMACYSMRRESRPLNVSHLIEKQQVLSRAKALRRVKTLLSQKKRIPPEALELIALFHLQADDLTEAGIAYEVVRALEKQFPLLLS